MIGERISRRWRRRGRGMRKEKEISWLAH